MENDDDDKKKSADNIKHQPQKEKQLGFLYQASCFISRKTYTGKAFDYVNKEGMLDDTGYETRLANNIEHGIQEQINEITTINKQLQNQTIEKILANQKNKRPHIINLERLLKIGDKNGLEIRDRNKKNVILTLKKEMEKELNFLANTTSLSFERYEQAALLVKETNTNMQKPTIENEFPTCDMKHFITKLTEKIQELEPEKEKTNEED